MLAAKAGAGLPVCVTVTLIDALVLARSALHHSLAYRSVVVVGDARPVEDPAEKLRALHCLLDHIASGRAADCRTPNARELAMTGVLALDLVEVSAKVRDGGVADDPEDLGLPYWAGMVPLQPDGAGRRSPQTIWIPRSRCPRTSHRSGGTAVAARFRRYLRHRHSIPDAVLPEVPVEPAVPLPPAPVPPCPPVPPVPPEAPAPLVPPVPP